MQYTCESLTKEQARWYGATVACFIVRFKGGFAPIRSFAAIDKTGKFTDNPATGYIHGNGNTGTGSLLLTSLDYLTTINL